MKRELIAFVILLVPCLAPKSSGRELFYFLVGNSVQSYDSAGVHQETFSLGSPPYETARTAMTTDGYTAWIVNDPEDTHSWIAGIPIRPGGADRAIQLDYSEYFFTGGLALAGETLILGRHRMPHPSYSPWFKIDHYRASTGAFLGDCTVQTWPDHMEWVNGRLAATGSSAKIHIYVAECGVERSFDVALYGGCAPTALCANNSYLWVFYCCIPQVNRGHAFDWGGNRRADQDIVFQGLATPTDGCIAWGPDMPNIRVEPDSMGFGDVRSGGSRSLPLRISNVGNQALSIASVTLSDTVNYSYSGPASTVIAPGAYLDTAVIFQPQVVGSFHASLTIASNDPDHPSLAVPLSGEGRAAISYVDGQRPVSGDGASWATAFNSLHAALAGPGVLDDTEIWVKEGTYVLAETLTINKRVAIYGGFAGDETSRQQRNWQANTTTIDGNNAVRCVKITVRNVTLDGLTIENGRNSLASPNSYGGGVCIEGPRAVIQNCTVRNCRTDSGFGGGIAVRSSPAPIDGSDAVIRNCTISGNTGGYYGGGIYNTAGNALISGCTVTANTATFGGGIYNECMSGIPPTVRNCVVAGNQGGGAIHTSWTDATIESCLVARNGGDGIYCYVTAAAITNCTAVENGDAGIRVVYADRTPRITNCIVWGNSGFDEIALDSGAAPVVTYSTVDSEWYGHWQTGEPDANRNMRKAPAFADPDGPDDNPATWQDNDYRLRFGCVCIDYGNGNTAPAADLLGNPRSDDPGTANVGGGTPDYTDIGAYEFQGATPGVLYVDGAAAPGGDGTSWAQAFDTIQEAVSASGAGNDVWVRQGTYVLTATLDVNKPVRLYGGFDGTETLRDYRDPAARPTIIDGNNTLTRCLHVRANAHIDGFTITRGNANVPSSADRGAGIYIDQASPTVANCTFTGNYAVFSGGAVYAYNSAASFDNCVFVANRIGSGGGAGGAYSDYSSRTRFANCLFAGNTSGVSGGALALQDQTAQHSIINCTFAANRAVGGSGAIQLNRASPAISNCILWANTAGYNPQINVVISGTPSVTYCCVQGGYAGTTNISTDPLFAALGAWDDNGTPADPADDTFTPGDYHLQSEHGRWDPASSAWVMDSQTSPCIDAGDPASDWSEELWPSGRRINIGCYGGTWQASHSGPIGTDLTRDGWVDESDLEVIAFSWLSDDETCDVYPPGGDGIIDLQDFAAISAAYRPEPEPIIINFETGAFDPGYTWATGGNPGWTVYPYAAAPDNQYHATSGGVPAWSNSYLDLTLDTGVFNTIEFRYAMFLATGWLKGEFHIDGVKAADLTSRSWTARQHSFTPGVHTFRWVGRNDLWLNEGESVRLDDIKFLVLPP